jgi:hypothetical protein
MSVEATVRYPLSGTEATIRVSSAWCRGHFYICILCIIRLVSYTRIWVCDIALIGCTLSLGKTQEGSGFQGEGYKGTMGDKGSQFTSNLGLRWTIPVTAGGSQVSKREYSKGNTARGTQQGEIRRIYSRRGKYWPVVKS